VILARSKVRVYRLNPPEKTLIIKTTTTPLTRVSTPATTAASVSENETQVSTDSTPTKPVIAQIEQVTAESLITTSDDSMENFVASAVLEQREPNPSVSFTQLPHKAPTVTAVAPVTAAPVTAVAPAQTPTPTPTPMPIRPHHNETTAHPPSHLSLPPTPSPVQLDSAVTTTLTPIAPTAISDQISITADGGSEQLSTSSISLQQHTTSSSRPVLTTGGKGVVRKSTNVYTATSRPITTSDHDKALSVLTDDEYPTPSPQPLQSAPVSLLPAVTIVGPTIVIAHSSSQPTPIAVDNDNISVVETVLSSTSDRDC
jgi:hypothetical protein